MDGHDPKCATFRALPAALATLSWQIAAAGFLLAVVYVFFALWPWLVILADLGSPLD